MISGRAPESYPTTGFSIAIASVTTRPNGSSTLGTQATSISANASALLANQTANPTASATPSSAAAP